LFTAVTNVRHNFGVLYRPNVGVFLSVGCYDLVTCMLSLLFSQTFA